MGDQKIGLSSPTAAMVGALHSFLYPGKSGNRSAGEPEAEAWGLGKKPIARAESQ